MSKDHPRLRAAFAGAVSDKRNELLFDAALIGAAAFFAPAYLSSAIIFCVARETLITGLKIHKALKDHDYNSRFHMSDAETFKLIERMGMLDSKDDQHDRKVLSSIGLYPGQPKQ